MKLLDVYKNALKEKYAIGAYNFYNIETLQGIVSGAEKSNSPVIIAVSESAIKYVGMECLVGLVNATKLSAKVPLFLHLDHGKNFEICKYCVDSGFDSVMIDASSLSFEENISLTKKVADYAHKHNVQVEGELGTLAGIEDDVNVKKSLYTSPIQAKEFVERTNIDSLAIAIGTSHGAYKFSGVPELRFDILDEIEKLLPNFPLVLHGASSVPKAIIDEFNSFGGLLDSVAGVPENILAKVCKKNIVKINVDTDLRLAMTAAIRKALVTDKKMFSPRDYLSLGKNAISELVYSKQELFGIKGKVVDL